MHEVNPKNPTETSPCQASVTSTRIEVFVDGHDDFIERAVAAGAAVGAAVENHFAPWRVHRQGGFTDPFGHNWSIDDKSPLQLSPR